MTLNYTDYDRHQHKMETVTSLLHTDKEDKPVTNLQCQFLE